MSIRMSLCFVHAFVVAARIMLMMLLVLVVVVGCECCDEQIKWKEKDMR